MRGGYLRLAAIVVSACLTICPKALAQPSDGLTVLTDRNEWIAAVGGRGAFKTIDFTGFPEGTVMTNQYLELGALFLDGNDYVWFTPYFLQDGWGVASDFDPCTIQFCEPQRFIAIDFPGAARIGMSYQGQGVGSSGILCCMNGGIGEFGGVISSQPFDRVAINDPGGFLNIDDIHFGRFPAIPGDTSFDDVVDVDDLINVIVQWGECIVPPDACPVPACAHSDLNADGKVDVNDLIEVLINWTR